MQRQEDIYDMFKRRLATGMSYGGHLHEAEGLNYSDIYAPYASSHGIDLPSLGGRVRRMIGSKKRKIHKGLLGRGRSGGIIMNEPKPIRGLPPLKFKRDPRFMVGIDHLSGHGVLGGRVKKSRVGSQRNNPWVAFVRQNPGVPFKELAKHYKKMH